MIAWSRVAAFGDEVDADLAVQLECMKALDIRHLELRNAWGTSVVRMDSSDLQRARSLLDAAGMRAGAIGSPVGKTRLEDGWDVVAEQLAACARACEILGTRLVRVFSFYVEPGGHQDARAEVVDRMGRLAALAEAAGLQLVHENEKGIYGDTPARCLDLLASIDSPALRHAFDPANFVQVGVHPMREAWPMLAAYTAHVHIKDARFSDGGVVPAGQGDGAIADLLAALVRADYQGFLTLEPHLQYAGPAGGYSGPEGLHVAAASLRTLLASLPL